MHLRLHIDHIYIAKSASHKTRLLTVMDVQAADRELATRATINARLYTRRAWATRTDIRMASRMASVATYDAERNNERD
jgi:hypothetical protein